MIHTVPCNPTNQNAVVNAALQHFRCHLSSVAKRIMARIYKYLRLNTPENPAPKKVTSFAHCLHHCAVR